MALPPAPAGKEDLAAQIDDTVSCVVVQTPDFYGHLHDLSQLAEQAHAAGALLVAVVTEAVSLGLVQPPGAMGADIVVGEGQSIGNALSFGGPYVGLFATRQKYVRQMPGRLCGETVDKEGRRGFVLTLSTREQHIRREKATSNICTNSGLCVLAFTIHMTLLGEAGLRRLARINHANAVALAKALAKVKGVTVLNDTFFNEFTIRVPGNAAEVIEKLAKKGVLGGVPASRLEPSRPELADLIVVASTEVNTDADRAAYVEGIEEGAEMSASTSVSPFIRGSVVRPCSAVRRRNHGRRLFRRRDGRPPSGGAHMLNRQGRPTAAGETVESDPDTFSGNRGLCHRGGADLRDRAHGYDRRRSAGAGEVRRAARQARARPSRSGCPASASRRPCGTTCGSARRTTASTPASFRSARAP